MRLPQLLLITEQHQLPSWEQPRLPSYESVRKKDRQREIHQMIAERFGLWAEPSQEVSPGVLLVGGGAWGTLLPSVPGSGFSALQWLWTLFHALVVLR